MTDHATPTTAAELETFTAKGGTVTVVPAKEPKVKAKRLPTTLVPEAVPAVEPPVAEPPAPVAPSTDFAADVRQTVQAWIQLHGAAKVAGAVRAAMRPEPKAKTGAAQGAGTVNPLPRGFSFDQDAIVTVLVDNPKKPMTKGHARWEAGYPKVNETKTVAQAIKDGVLLADLRWDSERAFIRIDPAPKS